MEQFLRNLLTASIHGSVVILAVILLRLILRKTPKKYICLLWLLAEFVLMCARVRKETAFTAANVKALGHIALAFFLGGVLLVVAGNPLMSWLLTGMRGVSSPVWGLLPSFAAWTAALLVRAIQVLLKRAVEMQTESDLTV